MRAGFTSLPARRCFLFLAVGHSPSYRQRKRSLGSARDDDSGRTFFQRTLYTIQRISIPHAVISSAARNLPCTLLFLAPFAKGFPFSAITHTTLSPSARKIPRLRSGWRYRNSAFQAYSLYATWNKPIPPVVISSAARNLPCTPSFLAPFAKGFPFSAIPHTALYRCARKIPPLRSGWQWGWRSALVIFMPPRQRVPLRGTLIQAFGLPLL